MVVIFIEVRFRVLPRWLIIFPLVFFGGYYAVYFYQSLQIQTFESDLQKNNPSLIYHFNSDQDHLVINHANKIVTRYRIPVVYEKNKTYRHLSYRMISSESCANIPIDREAGIYTSNVHYRETLLPGRKFGHLRSREGLCILRMPEKPRKNIIQVNSEEEKRWEYKSTIEKRTHTILKNGKVLGEYHTASVWRFYGFPLLLIGSTFSSGPIKWKNFYDFKKTHYRLKTNPLNVGQKIKTNPVALMLGLEKYDEKDYSTFKEYPENTLLLKSLIK